MTCFKPSLANRSYEGKNKVLDQLNMLIFENAVCICSLYRYFPVKVLLTVGNCKKSRIWLEAFVMYFS